MNNCYFIVRHGQSVLNEKKYHQGWTSCNPLTEKGKLQAEEAVKKLIGQGIELIYASPLLRTKQTAKIIAKKLNLPIGFSSRLKDSRRWIKYEGLPVPEMTKEELSLLEGESMEHFSKRVIDFAKWLDKNFQNKNILVVTHNGVAKFLIEYWLGGTVDANAIENAQINKINQITKSIEFI